MTTERLTTDVKKQLVERLQNLAFRQAYGSEDYRGDLARLIFQARSEERLTQLQLAKLWGCSQPYIAKLESGTANPTVGQVGAMLATIWRRVESKAMPMTFTGVARPWSVVPGDKIEEEKLAELERTLEGAQLRLIRQGDSETAATAGMASASAVITGITIQ